MGLFDPVDPLKTDAAKVRFFYIGQKAWGINNLLGLCNFCSVPIHALTFTKLVEVVQAITDKKFTVYLVSTVDEAISLLTGLEAGERNSEGVYPEDSINGRIEATLLRFAMDLQEFEKGKEEDAAHKIITKPGG